MGADEDPMRQESQLVPLHEWTHTRQSPQTLASEPLREGSAQANTQRLARLLGLNYVPASSEYERLADLVRRRLGPDWIRAGQYGGF